MNQIATFNSIIRAANLPIYSTPIDEISSNCVEVSTPLGPGFPTNAVGPSKLYDFADTARPNAWTTSQTDLRCRLCSAQRVVHRVINSPRMLAVLLRLGSPRTPTPGAERIARRVRINPRRETRPKRWRFPPRMGTHAVSCAIREVRTRHPARSRVIREDETIKIITRGQCA